LAPHFPAQAPLPTTYKQVNKEPIPQISIGGAEKLEVARHRSVDSAKADEWLIDSRPAPKGRATTVHGGILIGCECLWFDLVGVCSTVSIANSPNDLLDSLPLRSTRVT
jgi:hypothetical protein